VLQLGTGNRVLDSTVTDTTGIGIGLYGVTATIVSGNRVSGSTFGFYVTPTAPGVNVPTGNTLAGNTATDNSMSGFALSDPRSTQLIGNRSSGNAGHGFILWSWKDGPVANRLADNMSTDNQWSGFAVWGGADNVLAGNTSADNDLGFNLASSGGLIAKDNAAAANVSTGFLVNTITGGGLTDNLATGNGGAGFNVNRSVDFTVLSNVANGNATGFVLFDASRNDLRRNTADQNVGVGFLAIGTNSVDSLFVRNDAHRNGLDARDATPPGATTWLRNQFGTTQNIPED
jgi:parallel beta-helix repeat protein